VDENNTSVPAGSSSFRVKQSSSYRITKEDDDLESCLSFEQHPSCAICLDRFKEGEDICSAQNKNCRHEFHLECIFPWLLKSQDCPCCRRDYLTADTDVSERGGGMCSSNTTVTATPPSATPAVDTSEGP
jgi:Ring finger domain